MNADDILAKARAREERPANWTVFPLLRNKIIIAIGGWIGGVIMGGGLLAIAIPIVIPGNYEHGIVAAITTTLILCVIAFIFVGSLVLLVSDIRRLREIEKHIIVITDEDFVKQEGAKVIQVPLSHVRYVTARGRPPSENNPSADTQDSETSLVSVPSSGSRKDIDSHRLPTGKGYTPNPNESSGNALGQMPSMRENMLGMLLGRGVTGSAKTSRKRMRTPTSLVFIDGRTEKEVTVVDDDAYGDPFLIAAVLKEHAAAVDRRKS